MEMMVSWNYYDIEMIYKTEIFFYGKKVYWFDLLFYGVNDIKRK